MLNLFPALLLVLVNLVPCILFQQKFGRALPVTMVAVSLFMIIFQFVFHSFQFAYYFFYVLAIAGIALTLFFKDRKKNLELVFSTGFVSFFVIVLVMILVDHDRIFSMWDELQHWGKMVKEMIRLDAFYNAEGTMLPHNLDYPPFISCFELFWVKMAGGYSEMNISVALHTFLFSLIVPVILDSKKSNDPVLSRILKPIIYFLPVFVLLMVSDISNTLFTIYVDVFIAALFAYCLYLVYTQAAMKTGFGFLAFSIGLTGLILSKQICIIFVLTCAAAYILTALFFMDTWKKRGVAILKLLGVMILPLIFYFIWNGYLSSLNIEATYGSTDSVSISDLLGLFQGKGDPERVEVAEEVLKYANEESYLNTSFVLNYPITILVGLVLLIIHGLIFRKEKAILKDTIFALGIALLAFLYVLAMIYVYAYCFMEETSAFGSLSRYYSTITIFALLFVLFVYLRSFQWFRNWRSLVLPLISAILCFALNPSVYKEELPDRSGKNPNQRCKDVADYIQQNVEQGKRVCIIFTSPYINDYRMKVNYYLDGIFVTGTSKNIMGIEFTDNTAEIESMGNRFSSADYVYIQDATGTFNWNCREYVENEEYVLGGLYKVSTEPTVKLSLVGINENNPDPKFWEENE